MLFLTRPKACHTYMVSHKTGERGRWRTGCQGCYDLGGGEVAGGWRKWRNEDLFYILVKNSTPFCRKPNLQTHNLCSSPILQLLSLRTGRTCDVHAEMRGPHRNCAAGCGFHQTDLGGVQFELISLFNSNLHN